MTIMQQYRTNPIPFVAALIAAALGACDEEAGQRELDVVSAEGAADGAEDELWEMCEQVLAGEEPAAPAMDAPAELVDAPHPTKGVCSAGEWKLETVELNCASCWHSATQAGKRVEYYRRWCYTAPSPPSCGCEPRELMNWDCKLGC